MFVLVIHMRRIQNPYLTKINLCYSHFKVLVAFLSLAFGGVLAITRHHVVGFGPKQDNTCAITLPDLVKTSRTEQNEEKTTS